MSGINQFSAHEIASPLNLHYYDALISQQQAVLSEKLFRCSNIYLIMYVCDTIPFTRCEWVTILGTKYKNNKCFMMIGVTKLQEISMPQFGMLYDIILYGDNPHVLFIFKVMETLWFNTNLGAYEVIQLAGYKCLFRSSLPCHRLFNAVHHGNHATKYIKSKYDLTVYCNY
jgi:hypothetical protein